MCVYIAFNYNMSVTQRGYGIVCMLVAHINTCTIHTETSAPVVCVSLYMFSVFYVQDNALWWACDRGDVVRAQELLSLGANINYHRQVSYSAHITH